MDEVGIFIPNHVVNFVSFEGDEDIGFNCGTAVYRAGEQTELSAMKNEEFANDLWDSFQNPSQQHDMEMGI